MQKKLHHTFIPTCLSIDLNDRDLSLSVSLDPDSPRAHDSVSMDMPMVSPNTTNIKAQKLASFCISSSGRTNTSKVMLSFHFDVRD